MEKESLNIDVVMDEKTFRKFASFDTVYRKKLWRSPAIFTGILAVSALVCFIFRTRAPQAMLLGSILLLVGIGVPVIYFRAFSGSVSMQVKNYKLAIPRVVYSLRLSDRPDGIDISSPNGEAAKYEWKNVHAVYRVKGCSYLYVAPNKAFLLPDKCMDEDALWSLFSKKLPPGKLFDRRK